MLPKDRPLANRADSECEKGTGPCVLTSPVTQTADLEGKMYKGFRVLNNDEDCGVRVLLLNLIIA